MAQAKKVHNKCIMFHVKHRKEKNMLSEIMVYLIIMILVIFVGCVIGYITLGKATRFYTRQILDEIDEYKKQKGSTENDDTFFNND